MINIYKKLSLMILGAIVSHAHGKGGNFIQ